MSALEAIRYSGGRLEVLDQLRLPHHTCYITVRDSDDAWNVIRNMQVRGAPAIGVVGTLSVAVEMQNTQFDTPADVHHFVEERFAHLVSARPTAVNMSDCANRFTHMSQSLLSGPTTSVQTMVDRLVHEMECLPDEDVSINQRMGEHGADHVMQTAKHQPITVLTHCNTGALATAGYGTALGVVRTLAARGVLAHCYFTETRPYLQGARLTAYELVHERLPATLIADSMAAALMHTKGLDAVLVGADRVVANGDTANKIGTYQIAIAARHHKVPFYVVAPSTSIDLHLASGEEIDIEERPPGELTSIAGVPVAAAGVGVWNPAFDVTPAALISGGIVTECGVFQPRKLHTELSRYRDATANYPKS